MKSCGHVCRRFSDAPGRGPAEAVVAEGKRRASSTPPEERSDDGGGEHHFRGKEFVSRLVAK